MIRTVIFDLGNVIVPFDLERGYAGLGKLCPYPAAEIPALLRSTGLVTEFEAGRIAPEAFFEKLRSALRLKIGYGEFQTLWSSIFLPHALIPDQFFQDLRRGYRLLLLSNTNAIHFPMVRSHYPELRHFDDYVLSHEVGALKPSAQIYEIAVARAGCAPEECFFTDDLAVNVEAARKFGMEAVQFQSFEQLQGEMCSILSRNKR